MTYFGSEDYTEFLLGKSFELYIEEPFREYPIEGSFKAKAIRWGTKKEGKVCLLLKMIEPVEYLGDVWHYVVVSCRTPEFGHYGNLKAKGDSITVSGSVTNESGIDSNPETFRLSKNTPSRLWFEGSLTLLEG